MLLTVGEPAHRQHTAVGASPAAGGSGGICQVQGLLQGQHSALLTPEAFFRDQRRAEGAHDSGNVRANGLDPRNLLKGPQHSLIVEGTSLNHHMASQLLGAGQLDDLVKGVFDDGVSKSRGDIGDGRPLLLGLLHVGIHKHGAAGAQIHGIAGKQRLPGKGPGGVSQRGREILNEGTAAGGAGLVEQDGIHRSVFQLDALHVLPADIQDAVHVLVKEGGGGTVGNGLHLALV